jgi:hypothetical protein
MKIRLRTGLKAGAVVDVEEEHVARAYLASGKAELVEPEVAPVVAEAEISETPEKPKRRGRRRAAATPETR